MRISTAHPMAAHSMAGGLLDGIRTGSVAVYHGTGTPARCGRSQLRPDRHVAYVSTTIFPLALFSSIKRRASTISSRVNTRPTCAQRPRLDLPGEIVMKSSDSPA